MQQFKKVIKGTWRIDHITDNCCGDLLVYLQRNYAKASVNSYLKGINAFMNWLRRKYKIDLPPKIKELKIERTLPEFLTPDELDRIYALCKDPKILATFRVYEHIGIRLRELHNCELDEATSGNYVKLKKTKGKRERIISKPPEIKEDFKVAMFAPYTYNSKKFEPYKPDYISLTFSMLRKKAVLTTGCIK